MTAQTMWHYPETRGSFLDEMFESDVDEQPVAAVEAMSPIMELIADGAKLNPDIARGLEALQRGTALDDTVELTPQPTVSVDPTMTMVMHIEPSRPKPEPRQADEAPQPQVDPNADTVVLSRIDQPKPTDQLSEQTEPGQHAPRAHEALDYVPPLKVRAYVATAGSLADTQPLPRHRSLLPPLDRTEVVEPLAVSMVEALDTSASSDVVWSKELAEVYMKLADLEASPIVTAHKDIRNYINEASKRQPDQPVPDPRDILIAATDLAEQAELNDHDKNVEAIEKYQSKPGMSYYVETQCRHEALIIDDPKTPLSVTKSIYHRLWTENRAEILALAAKEHLVDEEKWDAYSQIVRRQAQRQASQAAITEEDQTPAVLISDAPAPSQPARVIRNFEVKLNDTPAVTDGPDVAVSPTQIMTEKADGKSRIITLVNSSAKSPDVEQPAELEPTAKDKVADLHRRFIGRSVLRSTEQKSRELSALPAKLLAAIEHVDAAIRAGKKPVLRTEEENSVYLTSLDPKRYRALKELFGLQSAEIVTEGM